MRALAFRTTLTRVVPCVAASALLRSVPNRPGGLLCVTESGDDVAQGETVEDGGGVHRLHVSDDGRLLHLPWFRGQGQKVGCAASIAFEL